MILGCGARRRSKRCLKRFSHGEKVGVLNSSRDDRALMRVRTPRGLTRISREACCRVIGIKMANGASIKGLTDFRLLSSRGYELDGRSPLPFRLSFSLRARDILSIHWILVYPNRGEIRNFRIEGSSDIVGLPGNMIKFRGSRLSARSETWNMRIGRRINSPIRYLLLPDERPLRVRARGPVGMLLSCVTIVGQRVTSVLWAAVRYEHIWTHAHARGLSTRHALAFCLRGVWI